MKRWGGGRRTAKMICMTSSEAEARSLVALASTRYFVLASTLLKTSSSCAPPQVSMPMGTRAQGTISKPRVKRRQTCLVLMTSVIADKLESSF
jgi:hypothetical protein